jgi:hypothetical protein
MTTVDITTRASQEEPLTIVQMDTNLTNLKAGIEELSDLLPQISTDAAIAMAIALG